MGTRSPSWWCKCSLSSWGYKIRICWAEYKWCPNVLKSKLEGRRILFKTWLLTTLASCQIFLFVVSFIKTKTHSQVLPGLGIQSELSRGPRAVFHQRSEILAVVNTHTECGYVWSWDPGEILIIASAFISISNINCHQHLLYRPTVRFCPLIQSTCQIADILELCHPGWFERQKSLMDN